MATNPIKFLTGTYAAYSALVTKDANTLYFADGRLYKGSVDYTDQVVCLTKTAYESLTTKVTGTIYIISDATSPKTIYWDGSAEQVIAEKAIQIDYTVKVEEDTTTVKTDDQYKLIDIKQGEAGSETKVGTIVLPNLQIASADGTSTDTFLKKYTFTYGANTAVEINIPKDLVVQSGKVVTVESGVDSDGESTTEADGTYLKLKIANQDAKVYIDVKSLAQTYTGKAVTDGGVSVAISATNEISAELAWGTIS